MRYTVARPGDLTACSNSGVRVIRCPGMAGSRLANRANIAP
jgi:hypothetical protein